MQLSVCLLFFASAGIPTQARQLNPTSKETVISASNNAISRPTSLPLPRIFPRQLSNTTFATSALSSTVAQDDASVSSLVSMATASAAQAAAASVLASISSERASRSAGAAASVTIASLPTSTDPPSPDPTVTSFDTRRNIGISIAVALLFVMLIAGGSLWFSQRRQRQRRAMNTHRSVYEKPELDGTPIEALSAVSHAFFPGSEDKSHLPMTELPVKASRPASKIPLQLEGISTLQYQTAMLSTVEGKSSARLHRLTLTGLGRMTMSEFDRFLLPGLASPNLPQSDGRSDGTILRASILKA